MDKFEALIGDVVLATLVAVVEAETDYGMLDMNCRKIADTKQKMLSAYTAIEAENKELKAWVRKALPKLTKFATCKFATRYARGEPAMCQDCHAVRVVPEQIPHAATCIITRGEKLLLEGADKEEVI